MYEEASEQRNMTAAWYSSIKAIRPSGTRETSRCTNSSGWPLATPPGEMALTRTPSLAHQVESQRVIPIRPAFTTE